MSSLIKGNRPKGLSFGNEYGLYNDIDDSMEYPVVDNTFSSYAKWEQALNSTPLKLSLAPCKVICEVDDQPSPTTCRSYTTSSSPMPREASICIDGLRIVQDETGEDAEYHVKLIFDGRIRSSWKRNMDFQELGSAFEEYTQQGINLKRSRMFTKTISAWRKYQDHRPWFCKNLSVQFLREETILLETLLSSLMFELPSVDLLLEFIAEV